ncbi:Gamma-tubulin complex component 3, partial [Stegodyphus mimosarum]
MIPSFITTVQARKILCTGKAINFLQHVCHDKSFARDDERRMRAFNLMHIESLFAQERDGNFEKILEKNYVKTNKIVLQVLNDKYHLMDHLLAMRNYFLLGQGDFIRHLMDLLNADLGKPVKYVDNLNLYGLLESAIRATNVQFHNPEVLQRLDVRLLDVSVIGDTGWDVFTLDYHTEGPIGTIFTSHSMNCYRRLFTALWRAKRMEFILNKISQSRSKYLNWQIKIPEISPVLYQCHVNLTHMVHFVQQMEYYMAFEVMECCWADLLMKMSSAQDLDQVIAAHENFLDTLLTRAFLDEESLPLRTQLKAIYDLIVEFDKVQATFWKNVRNIINKLKELEQLVDTNTNKDTWGITERHKKEYNGLLAILQTKHIPTTKAELQILFRSFEEMVQKFLIMLNDHNDSNL